ncbi:type VII secretion protein EccB [uncultured Corynebacterium sp.]|uniref:type VII secretion protein EccB n=1 Tax=uncultured Corynebacterium sp. TaxID=159447 RepID=UPI002595069D|nr:type VII secretion protein EccB [uncultured Corynebacterium sp.]
MSDSDARRPSPTRLLPTTRPQVSGHRFMRRRVEHGLLFGDIRMIHDPLAARRRALLFGAVAVALLMAGAALFAWLRPNPDPGDAAILRDPADNLYVRVDGTAHPVANLTSARLVAGAAEEPVRAGEEHLAGMPRGVPVGIANAPSLFAAADSADLAWSVCTTGAGTPSSVTVSAVEPGQAPRLLGSDRAVLAAADGGEWLVTESGRTRLPAPDSPAGRVVRRALGVDASTPRWQPPAPVLGALREHPPVQLPDPLPEVLRTEAGAWAIAPGGGVQSLSPTQADILGAAGAVLRDVPRDALAAYPDASPPIDLRLPGAAPDWVDPAEEGVCVGEDRGGATAAPEQGAVRLSGGAAATHFAGLRDGAVAVDTGHGFHVVSIHGQRHEVESGATLEVIGAEHTEHVPWEILRLLPGGELLSREAALTAVY